VPYFFVLGWGRESIGVLLLFFLVYYFSDEIIIIPIFYYFPCYVMYLFGTAISPRGYLSVVYIKYSWCYIETVLQIKISNVRSFLLLLRGINLGFYVVGEDDHPPIRSSAIFFFFLVWWCVVVVYIFKLQKKKRRKVIRKCIIITHLFFQFLVNFIS
jgi:hypothetical protein